ncbi:MAG TPA: hypothetical protein VM238_07550 [Phycisphaerae bacterium]|nr:hypothetical protein [Phycisphaerae bacterium]
MALDREYKISASSHACQGCARPFGVGDEYYSAVLEVEGDEMFARHDFCPDCWKPGAAEYFSFWKTRVPEPEQPRRRGPQLVDLSRLMELFEHLGDAEEERALRFRYVLTLVLMRKRRLRVLSSRRLAGGRGEELTLREPGTDRRHLVRAPSISDDEIRAVSDRLRDVLDMPDRWDQLDAEDDEPAPPVEDEPDTHD